MENSSTSYVSTNPYNCVPHLRLSGFGINTLGIGIIGQTLFVSMALLASWTKIPTWSSGSIDTAAAVPTLSQDQPNVQTNHLSTGIAQPYIATSDKGRVSAFKFSKQVRHVLAVLWIVFLLEGIWGGILMGVLERYQSTPYSAPNYLVPGDDWSFLLSEGDYKYSDGDGTPAFSIP